MDVYTRSKIVQHAWPASELGSISQKFEKLPFPLENASNPAHYWAARFTSVICSFWCPQAACEIYVSYKTASLWAFVRVQAAGSEHSTRRYLSYHFPGLARSSLTSYGERKSPVSQTSSQWSVTMVSVDPQWSYFSHQWGCLVSVQLHDCRVEMLSWQVRRKIGFYWSWGNVSLWREGKIMRAERRPEKCVTLMARGERNQHSISPDPSIHLYQEPTC